jgi:hypothetical protein
VEHQAVDDAPRVATISHHSITVGTQLRVLLEFTAQFVIQLEGGYAGCSQGRIIIPPAR